MLNRGGITTINDKGGTSCDGITPLYDACSNGYLDVVELLLERGANATLKTDFGDTTLNVLDKWRNTVELNHYEQLQYERIRSKLYDQLNKAGLLTENSNINNPLTNKNDNDFDDDSLEKLRRIAYESDSNDSNDEKIVKVSRESKRSSKSNRHSLNSDNDDDNVENYDDIIEKRSCNESTLSNDSSTRANATAEYKNVMENLKHPNRKYSTNINYDGENAKFQQKRRSGFLDSDEVDDDWLINDLPSVSNKKKRKYFTDEALKRNENQLVNLGLFNDDYDINDDCDNSRDAFRVLLESKGKQKNIKKSKSSLSLNRQKSFTTKQQQSTLIDIGFNRSRSRSRASSINSVNEENIEPDSTTIVNLDSIQTTSTNSKALTTSTVPFRIKVENELFLVPVDKKKITELNIRWLAEEVSRRYYK